MAKNSNKPQQEEEITNSNSPEVQPPALPEQPLVQHYCQKLEEIIN